MRFLLFFVVMAIAGYTGGSFVGWTLSREEVRKAMCAYYSEWDFCEKYKPEKKLRDLAIAGLSERLRRLEMKLEGGKEYLCVKAYRLNIRLYPSDGKVIGIYKKGSRVEVIDRIGGWVRTKDGWVSERWLERCAGEN